MRRERKGKATPTEKSVPRETERERKGGSFRGSALGKNQEKQQPDGRGEEEPALARNEMGKRERASEKEREREGLVGKERAGVFGEGGGVCPEKEIEGRRAPVSGERAAEIELQVARGAVRTGPLENPASFSRPPLPFF